MKLEIIVILAVTMCWNTLAGVIKGTVKGEKDGKPVEFGFVSILESTTRVSIGTRGEYVISDVHVGTHALKASSWTDVSQTDSVFIADPRDTIDHDIYLKTPVVESPPYLEEYHQALQNENARTPVITIHLDCLTIREGFVTIHASMQNNSTVPIHVLRIYGCINPIEAIVTDNGGEVIKPNLIMIDCMEKVLPDRNDMILVPGGQTIDYPPVKLQLYDFRRLPSGTYRIALKYRFTKPDQLYGLFTFENDYRTTYQDNIDALTKVLRGEYTSSNSVTVENMH